MYTHTRNAHTHTHVHGDKKHAGLKIKKNKFVATKLFTKKKDTYMKRYLQINTFLNLGRGGYK